MKVFITGASGFIGRVLAGRLRADGHEVGGVDLVADPAAGVVAGNVAVAGPWQDRAQGCDVVIHTAAYVGLRVERPREVWEANVLGTVHALEAAERAGARLVHFSSVTVFGFDFPDGVDERHPVEPVGVPYIDTKIASEQVVLQAHGEGRVEAVVIRPGDVCGPGSGWAVRPATLIRDRRLVLPAGGRGIFSPVWVGDLVDGVVRASTAPEAAGQVITLSGGIGVTNREFFAPYAELVGRRLLTLPAPLALGMAGVVQQASRLRPGDNDVNPRAVRYFLRRGTYSVAKARRLLGWEPRTGVDEILRRTLDWLRTQGF